LSKRRGGVEGIFAKEIQSCSGKILREPVLLNYPIKELKRYLNEENNNSYTQAAASCKEKKILL